ncbi:MAG: tetratricopeptide repeat protein [Deltaproteobacteria bacterium]|nr:tetratricopeptide repeat protein [Deltaproteobacteria bacterium]
MFKKALFLFIILLFTFGCGTKKELSDVKEKEKKYSIEENKQITFNYYNIGLRQFKSKQYQKAILSFSEALKYNKKHISSYYMRGLSAFYMNLPKVAIEDLSKTIKIKPNFMDAYHMRGVAYFFTKQYQKAISDFSKVLSVGPNKYSFRFRGKSYVAIKNYNKAINDFSSFILIDPGFAEIYYERGTLLMRLKKYNKSIVDFNKAISLNSKKYMYYAGRSNSYIAKKNYKKSITDISIAISLEPDSYNLYKFRYDIYYDKLYDLKKALYDSNKMIELSKGIIGYSQRAKTYFSLGYFDKSIADYSKLIKIDKYFINYLTRGLIYKTKRDYKNAIKDVNHSISLRPDFPYTKIIKYLINKQAGEKASLVLHKGNSDIIKWTNSIVKLYHGKISPSDLIKRSSNRNKNIERNFICEGYYYIAEYFKLKGDKNSAKKYYRKCIETKSYDVVEYSAAIYELKRL